MSNESFTIFENDAYWSKKNLMFAKNFEATSIKVDSFIFSYTIQVNVLRQLASKLIQHLIAFGPTRNLDTGSFLHIFW